MENIRQQKTMLIKILSGDVKFVLQRVDEARLITPREYDNLKDSLSNHSREDFIIDLLDKLKHKGDKHCHRFLELLEDDDMQETFPLLNERLIPPAMRQVVPVQESSDNSKAKEYKMSSSPRGVCVIISNTDFQSLTVGLTNRRGSDADVECLTKVFMWLGFSVEVYNNMTAEGMKDLLLRLSQKEHKGDCFVCCILTHEGREGFYGIDGETVTSSNILKLFGRTNCSSLADKPKVFILHNGWDEATHAIPDSDFLLALATIPGLHSYRHIQKGTWFIQSLCKMLKEGCTRGDDVLTILGQVTEEVSMFKKDHPNLPPFRQIPQTYTTLTKRLIFHVPDQEHPGSQGLSQIG